MNIKAKNLKTKNLYVGTFYSFKSYYRGPARIDEATIVNPVKVVLVKKNILNQYKNAFNKKRYFTFKPASTKLSTIGINFIINNIEPLELLDPNVVNKREITYKDAEESINKIQSLVLKTY